jgi:hypothetical protein
MRGGDVDAVCWEQRGGCDEPGHMRQFAIPIGAVDGRKEPNSALITPISACRSIP